MICTWGVSLSGLDNCFESLRTRMVHSNFIHLCLWCVFFRCMEKIAWIQGTTHGCQSLVFWGSHTEELQLFLVLVLLLVYTTTVMGNPPHHSHGDLWIQAQHTHVFPAAKSGCFRILFLPQSLPQRCWWTSLLRRRPSPTMAAWPRSFLFFPPWEGIIFSSPWRGQGPHRKPPYHHHTNTMWEQCAAW